MRYSVILFMSALLLTACGKKADDNAANTQKTPVDRNTNTLLLTASNQLVDKFSKELKSELMAALNEGGPVNAINVCQVKAPEIARACSGEFWTIRRVTDRNRNPDNLAGDSEMSMLARFADSTTVTPEYLVAWNDTDSGKVYTYYRPIKVAPLCLKCHGTAEDIDDALAAVLAEKYPTDRAIGYKPGDLRGMFVVEVRWPEGKVFADSIAALAGSEAR